MKPEAVPPPAEPGFPTAEHGEALLQLGLEWPDGMDDEGDAMGQEDRPGRVIGGYELVELLGEGGFGLVWRVQQREPIRREAALKVVKRGMDSRQVIARFAAERRAVAMMDHPNIAAVFDAGTAPCGRPFFAMELVRGVSLTSYCDERTLGLRERLRIFIPVCQAVQHAHQKAILHRDLKPSNILVAEVDGMPVPKVIDFGIAKALGTDGETGSDASLLRTLDGSLMGTLQYMSPEQAGSVPDVDTRSDIYSLGSILHELLTGRPPLVLPPGGGAAYDETLRRIREEEAKPPSRCMPHPTEFDLAACEGRGTDPVKLRRMLRGDLDWIVMKALAKDRQRRYATVNALAADLERYLKSEPVSAAAPSWRYRAWKFTRRYRAALATGVFVLGVLIAGTTVSLWQAAAARKAGAVAEQNRLKAEVNFGKARDAVNIYLSEVTDDPQLGEMRFLPLRKKLLETALPYFQDLATARDEESDPELRLVKAAALTRLGEIYRLTDAPDRAHQSLEKAIEILQKLFEQYPGEERYAHSLILSLNDYGMTWGANDFQEKRLGIARRALEVLDASERTSLGARDAEGTRVHLSNTLVQALTVAGKIEEAEKVARANLVRAEDQVKEEPENRQFLMGLANARDVLTSILWTERKLDEAEWQCRESLCLREEIFRLIPDDTRSGMLEALGDRSLGVVLAEAGQKEAAAGYFRTAIEKVLELKRQGRLARRMEMDLACLYATEGLNFRALQRTGEAKEAWLQADALYGNHLGDSSAEPDDFYLAAVNGWHLAQIAGDEKNQGEEVRLCTQGAGYAGRASLGSPMNMKYVKERSRQLRRLALIYREMGQPEKALQVVTEMPDSPGATWEDHQETALLIAALLTDLKARPPGSPDGGEEGRKATARIVENLRMAVRDGDPNLEFLKKDARFEMVRDSEDFRALSESPADEVDGCPARFTFDYIHDDPGKRLWSREGRFWTETLPSGAKHHFEIVGRVRLGGVSGTDLLRDDHKDFHVFIPDKGAQAEPLLLLRSGGGGWRSLGEIAEME